MRVENTSNPIWITLPEISHNFVKQSLKNNQIDSHFPSKSQTEMPWHAFLSISLPSKSITIEQPVVIKHDKPPINHDFIRAVWSYAEKTANALGLKPAILIAQVILETGWGKHISIGSDGSSSNNVFNIKALASDAASVEVKTREYVNQSFVQIKDRFKKYDSIEACFDDYAVLLKNNPRYMESLQEVSDPSKFIHSLQKAGYATDPDYAEKILAIYKQLNSQ